MVSYGESDGFLTGILPHEMTHLMLREYMGEESQAPLWFHEGTAQMQEDEQRVAFQYEARVLARAGRLSRLKDLSKLDVRKSHDHSRARRFYVEAVSLSSFLLNRYGEERYGILCRRFRKGDTLEQALKFTYPHTISTLEKLEEGWIEYLLENSK